MNAVEKLLSFQKDDIKIPTKIAKLKLKKLKGEEFSFPLQAVDPEVISELQESMAEYNPKADKMKMNGSFHMKAMIIIHGCPSIFKDSRVKEHYGAASPKDLVKTILTTGEIDELYGQIQDLNGYEENEEDVKN